MSGRILIAVVVLAVLGSLFWLLQDTLGEPDEVVISEPVISESSGVTAPAPEILPAEPSRPETAPLVEASTPVMSPQIDVDVEADPVFAHGWVLPPGPMEMSSLEIALFDDVGDEVAWTTPNDEGYFEIEYDEPLLAGWGVGSESSEAEDAGRMHMVLPAFSGHHESHGPGQEPVECELRILFTPRIQGIVTSRATGEVIADAEVSLGSNLAPWQSDSVDTTTDSNGFYALTVEFIPVSDVLIWCRGWDYQATVVGPVDLSNNDVVTLDFQLDAPQVVRGRVIDAATGRPIADATVTLGSAYVAFEDDQDWDFSNEDGSFELDAEDLPLEGTWVHVETMGEYAPAAVALTTPLPESVELQLGPVPTVRGIVRDHDGEPVADAAVWLVYYRGWLGIEDGISNDEITDEDGSFTMTVDLAPPMESELVVISDEHVPFTIPFRDVASYDQRDNTYTIDVTLPN